MASSAVFAVIMVTALFVWAVSLYMALHSHRYSSYIDMGRRRRV